MIFMRKGKKLELVSLEKRRLGSDDIVLVYGEILYLEG